MNLLGGFVDMQVLALASTLMHTWRRTQPLVGLS